jgi:7-cyano-7-deazaguanine tRNA-ribosyltransferase
MNNDSFFEVKAVDLAGRIANFKTKTSEFETPALLPVIHPVKQRVPCSEIRSMGYGAVMTNAYTIFSKLRDGPQRTVHEIIGFDGSIMTDSGGYQVLEFGDVDVTSEDIARQEERIGSDIAVILDRPTGLDVTRRFAKETVNKTIQSAEVTKRILSRENVIWTLPIQGGKYIDLVRQSARRSAILGYDCFALGSPVEVMEEYDFALLAKMIIAAKSALPQNRPFHLFGAGHPLILPLAVALGCDTFDSASYMLYAKKDRYISSSGTIRLEQLEYLSCPCKVCSRLTARELKACPKDERTLFLARHNLAILLQTVQETKQAIWEGRLWELASSSSKKHPRAFEAFRFALTRPSALTRMIERGTPRFKERGVFVTERNDLARPETSRHGGFISNLNLKHRTTLLILPETKSKPFLKSDIFEEVSKILWQGGKEEGTIVCFPCPNYGLIPAEISDIYPLSQTMSPEVTYPDDDLILNSKIWDSICVLKPDAGWVNWGSWLTYELRKYFRIDNQKFELSQTGVRPNRALKTKIYGAKSYKSFKKLIATTYV